MKCNALINFNIDYNKDKKVIKCIMNCKGCTERSQYKAIIHLNECLRYFPLLGTNYTNKLIFGYIRGVLGRCDCKEILLESYGS